MGWGGVPDPIFPTTLPTTISPTPPF